MSGAPLPYAVYADGREYHRGSPEQRFWGRVDLGAGPDDCWGWRGSRGRYGYGRLGIQGKEVELAHRFSWRLHFGEIPDGLCVLHGCDNPPCTNPRHLFLGTMADNNADMRRKGRENPVTQFSRERFTREGHPRAKLTQRQVDEIRALYVPRQVTRRALAERFGVSEPTISAIVDRRLWREDRT